VTSLFRIPPLLLPLCLFICGIAAAGSFGLFLPDYLLPAALLIPALPLFFRSRTYFIAAICLPLFVLGNVLIQPIVQEKPETRLSLEENSHKALMVEGIIVSRPAAREDGYRIVIRPEKIEAAATRDNKLKIDGLLLLRIGKGGDYFASGDRIRFQGKLKAPRNFGTAGEFDIERFYAFKGIAATSFVKSAADIITLSQGADLKFQRHFDRKAAEIGRFIMSRLPGTEGGILKALLIGDMADIPQQIKDQYSRTGVNHILSISGFHVGIIALALCQIWFVVSRIFPIVLLYCNFRRLALLVSLPLVIYYLFLSGAAPATAGPRL